MTILITALLWVAAAAELLLAGLIAGTLIALLRWVTLALIASLRPRKGTQQ